MTTDLSLHGIADLEDGVLIIREIDGGKTFRGVVAQSFDELEHCSGFRGEQSSVSTELIEGRISPYVVVGFFSQDWTVCSYVLEDIAIR